MGRIVYCPLVDLSVTNDADQDIWELAAVTNKVKLHAFELYSAATTAESINLRLARRSTTGNGSAATPVLADIDDGTITAGVETLATTPGTIGAVLCEFTWEQLGPLIHMPTPALQITVEAGTFLCLNLQTALAGTTVMTGWLAWEEI